MTSAEVDDAKKKESIKGKCYNCGIAGHRVMNCWEKEEDAHLGPKNWVGRKKEQSEKDGKEVNGAIIELEL